MASVVPKGIDFEGFFKSPDKPTPAVIPVNAGKQIAKTIKKFPEFRNELENNEVPDSAEYPVFPKKNSSNDKNNIPTTKYNVLIPMLAPFFKISKDKPIITGMLITWRGIGFPLKNWAVQLKKGSKASVNAIT